MARSVVVKAFEHDASGKSVSGVIGSGFPSERWPYPLRTTVSSPRTTTMARPGDFQTFWALAASASTALASGSAVRQKSRNHKSMDASLRVREPGTLPTLDRAHLLVAQSASLPPLVAARLSAQIHVRPVLLHLHVGVPPGREKI